MQTVEYWSLLESDLAPSGSALVDGVYERGHGVQFRSMCRENALVSEVVRLNDQALLLAGNFMPDREFSHRQLVGDRDWIHLQFRYCASGLERVDNYCETTLPQRSCIISGYAQGSEIVRELSSTEKWTHVCLFATREGLSRLLDVSLDRLEGTILGPLLKFDHRPQAHTIGLQPIMVSLGHDILSCSLRGLSRHTFMRAKSIELISSVFAATKGAGFEQGGNGGELSSKDLQRVIAARDLMAIRLEGRLTLSEIARKVGMSRTKLATSFKSELGVTVQDYWRNLRLMHAHRSLQMSDVSVTQVAYDVGYSEASSFTKAFQAKFGYLPRDCKRKSG